MTLVASGDPAAQNQVAQRLVHRVRRLSRMMLLDQATADDASQLALIEILRSARTYRGQSSVERWADRIAARTAIRHVRDERRRAAIPLDDGAPEAGDTVQEPPQSSSEFTARPITDYLAELPEVQREAIVLKHSLDYTTEEIAEVMGVAVGTVKDRLVTARKQLRKLIQRDLRIGARSGGHR